MKKLLQTFIALIAGLTLAVAFAPTASASIFNVETKPTVTTAKKTVTIKKTVVKQVAVASIDTSELTQLEAINLANELNSLQTVCVKAHPQVKDFDTDSAYLHIFAWPDTAQYANSCTDAQTFVNTIDTTLQWYRRPIGPDFEPRTFGMGAYSIRETINGTTYFN